MLLTMPVLADGLNEYNVEKAIAPNSGALRGIRLGARAEKQGYAYLSRDGDAVVCCSGQDCIRVANAEIEDVFNAISILTEKLQSWESGLDDCLANGGSLEDLLNLSVPILKNPIFIVDQREIVYAMTDHPAGTVHSEWDFMRSHGRMPFPRISAIYHESDFKNIRRASDDNGEPFIFQPPGMASRGINFRIPDPSADSFLGILVIIENETPISDGMIHLSRTLNDAIVRWTRLHEKDHNMKNISHLFTDLLDGAEIDDDEININKALNNLESELYILAVVPPMDERKLQFIAPALESEMRRSRCFEYGGYLLALCPVDPSQETFMRVILELAERFQVRIGISYPFASWRALKNAFKQAVIALEFTKDKMACLDAKSALSHLVSELASSLQNSEMAHPALGVLEDYDRRHGTQYNATLFAFLKNERNLIRTAASLFIHRNSLVYRVSRINELIDVNLDDYDERQYLLLSYLSNQGSKFRKKP